MITLTSAAALAWVMACPIAQAENPPDTQKSEIDPRAPGDPAGLSPRGDYPPAQADKGTLEQRAETIEKEALTPDKPADAGVDDLNKQQQQEKQQTATAGSGDVPKVYDEQQPADAAPKTGEQQQSTSVAPKPGEQQQSAKVTPKPGEQQQSAEVSPKTYEKQPPAAQPRS